LYNHLRDVPAIALSGLGQESDKERAAGAGFQEHLTKPLNMDELIRIVNFLRPKEAAAAAHS